MSNQKKVKIDKDLCIGCGTCEITCPEIFELKDGKAQVKKDADFKKGKDCLKKAIDNCPVEAIKED